MTEQQDGVIEADFGAQLVPQSGAGLDRRDRAEIDIQISTAKQYPRSIKRFRAYALELATLTEDIAERCFYAMPRAGKSIEGPSARLAEIVVAAWGNVRAGTSIVGNDGRYVTAKGFCWDLENNVAIATEVRRRITDKNGRTYNDDMIGTTANAAASIALRNAVFKVIPNALTQEIYAAARKVAAGDASTLSNKRADILQWLVKRGATEERILAVLGVAGVEDIGLDELVTLKGIGTAIRDGETTTDDAFPIIVKADAPEAEKPKTRRGSAAVTQAIDRATQTQEVQPSAPEPTPEPEPEDLPDPFADPAGEAAETATAAPESAEPQWTYTEGCKALRTLSETMKPKTIHDPMGTAIEKDRAKGLIAKVRKFRIEFSGWDEDVAKATFPEGWMFSHATKAQYDALLAAAGEMWQIGG